MADKNIKSEERRIDQILCELFQGRDAAIEKYARVRHTQWEMNLWHKHGLPLKEVDGVAKNYFGKRFLNGVGINSATKEELTGAFERLAHAVKNGCHGRCFNLVVELNAALGKLGIDMISDPEQFLDWLTFDYETKPDDYGNPAVEKPYGFEIRIFHDAENRKEFWNELLPLLKMGKVLSMTDTFRFVREKRKRAKSFL